MINKKIIVIGGGISGLSVLHYLNKGNPELAKDILLVEKNNQPGGTIQTQSIMNTLFETGPNGFLFPENETFDLAEDLDIQDQMCTANANANQRYVLRNNRLRKVPSAPHEIFSFAGLSIYDKCRLFLEPLIRKGDDLEESVYDFCSRRLGVGCAEYIADPIISGVFGGDIRRLSISSAFPSIYKMEQKYGSLIRAGLHQKKSNNSKNKKKLMSFSNGMGQLIDALYKKYKDQIICGEAVQSISFADDRYNIETSNKEIQTDIVVSAAPAYATAGMISDLNSDLKKILLSIHYAPIVVIGLAFKKKDCPKIPIGFGYLVPSIENKDVLGVLFESNIFKGRANDEEVMLRVMIGGRIRENLVNKNPSDLQKFALKELEDRFGITAKPTREFFMRWDQAIPQYEKGYNDLKKKIYEKCAELPQFYIASNYLNGIAFNDCVRQGKIVASKILEY